MRIVAVVLLASLASCAESEVVDLDPCAAFDDQADCCAAGCTFLTNHEQCVASERVCLGDSPRPDCPVTATCADVRDYGGCYDACVTGGGCLTAITPYGICTPWTPPDGG